MPHGNVNRAKSTCAWRPAPRLEANHGRGRRHRADPPDEDFQLGVAACIACGPDLVEQPHGGQLRIRGKARFDDRRVCRDFGGHRRARPVAHGLAVQIPIEIAGADLAMNPVAMDAELARQGALARSLLQVVPE